MLPTIYPIISLIFLVVTSAFIALLLLRLMFNYTDPNPFGKVGRFSYKLKKSTDKFVYPAARLLAQFRIDTRLAPIVTILITAILSYFLLGIIENTLRIIDGLTEAISRNNAKALIGWMLYALVSIYILFIFIRFIGSWFVFTRKTFLAFVYRVTDPVLLPVQRLIPPIGMFDISAMLVLLLLGFLQTIILRTFVF
ncbi:MAG: YggT family protein [Pyrinomonadaceae bacterium]|nr:YggT family protein [Pyrinomonadaceae bacterium]